MDSYDKLFGTQIKLYDGLKATVSRCVTDLNGIPLMNSTCQSTAQHEALKIEFEDGTKDAYFANIIAENLYSHVDSEGSELLAFKEINDHCKNRHAISKDDGFVISKNETRLPNGQQQGGNNR